MNGVAKADYAKVAEACTLCDMCFMTKCPYVPPHPFDVDFPHLILRHRAARRRHGEKDFVRDQLGQTDRNGKLAAPVAGLANWATDKKNRPVRKTLEFVAGIDADAPLPRYHNKTAERLLSEPLTADPGGPAFGQRKALIYATCFADYNEPETAVAAARSLAKLGVEVRLDYPGCCGMPKLEGGDLAAVAKSAEAVAAHFAPLIAQGHDVVALTASCALMLKFEWPLILPENEAVARLAAATRDVGEYVVEVVKAHGEPEGLSTRSRRRHPAPRLPRAGAGDGDQVGRDAAPDPRHQGRHRRALLGPRRHLRGDEGHAGARAEGRPPRPRGWWRRRRTPRSVPTARSPAAT